MPLLSRKRGSVVAVAGLLIAAAGAGGFAWKSRVQADRVARAITGGDPSRAPVLMRRYGCVGCHTIPGVPGGNGQVGSSLSGIRGRVYIAGVTTNSPDNLVQWIVAPQTFSPRTAMPVTGISESEARDIAAYLYAQ
ncbi:MULTISPECIES: c-type cytochrome [unclassified Bradyrhizobium]|uniref:c-type cytochrome n=1 Tax=unclassified Bradyrhizobium TaxID=2631580 RepID=UPI002478FE90|nr:MULTISPECIES: c-type cytochrome [unclassified Bradyrhizobium]WGR72682.1 cytochrome C [Bradyrhizobium sp. ISRA426]WGR77515.1 cytochrome C [Bradyrhizobium sp. ISRA430]WGR87921.1 cytochrome C [Bradyrhizobium sp. ISRA432]